MMTDDDLAIVGCGNMGEAILRGLLRCGVGEDRIIIVENNDQRRLEVERRYKVKAVSSSEDCSARSAVIATQPSDVKSVLLSGRFRRVLSVAAGIEVATLLRWVGNAGGQDPIVVRAMPNTPSAFGAGATGMALGTARHQTDIDWAMSITNSIGLSVIVDERHLDAVTAIAASGVAYVFLLAESMVDGGVLEGLNRKDAAALIAQTIVGAGAMLSETPQESARLRTDVCTPGGTTAAAIRALEVGAFRAAVMNAVSSAATRSREIALLSASQ
jgi:pyrroline-5-carboxylate reductase